MWARQKSRAAWLNWRGRLFIKIEATKFTEVGYVGRDVDSIVRDLVDVAINMLREEQLQDVAQQAEDRAEERILDALLPAPRDSDDDSKESSTRQMFRKKLREGELDDKEIDIDLEQVSVGVEIMAPPGMEEMTSQLQNMFSNLNQGKRDQQRLTIREAYRRARDEEAAKLVNEDEIRSAAVDAVEQTGIVFLDELDKVAKRTEGTGADVSREGATGPITLNRRLYGIHQYAPCAPTTSCSLLQVRSIWPSHRI